MTIDFCCVSQTKQVKKIPGIMQPDFLSQPSKVSMFFYDGCLQNSIAL